MATSTTSSNVKSQPDSGHVLIAVAQLNSSIDVEGNFKMCEQLVQRASQRNAAMIFFPECFAFLGSSPNHIKIFQQHDNSKLLQRYCDLAKRYGIWCSYGGFQLHVDTKANVLDRSSSSRRRSSSPARVGVADGGGAKDGERSGPSYYNSHIVVDNQGSVVAYYNKVHLFDVDLSATGGPVHKESSSLLPGDKLVVCDSPIGKIGLSVCYDVRFGTMFESLRAMGATSLLVPAAFTLPTGVAHWHVLLRARAIENQCYVIAAAQCGKHNVNVDEAKVLGNVSQQPSSSSTAVVSNATGAQQKPVADVVPRETFGHGLVVDGWGTVVAECPEGVSLAFAEVGPLEKLTTLRRSMPVQAHKRPDLYKVPTSSL